MKQKKAAKKMTPTVSAPANPAPAPEKEAEVVSLSTADGLTKRDWLTLVLFFAVVLTSLFLTIGRWSNIVMLLFLLFTIRKSSLANLKEHLSLPVIGFVGMVLMYGAAGIYSPFGESAVLELFRGLVAFSVAGFVLLRFQKKHVPALLWGFVILTAVVSFVSLDGAASGPVFDLAVVLSELCGAVMSGFDTYSSGRVAGIFNNSNALAGMTGMALLIGLYQIQTTGSKKGRFAAAFVLGINAMVFWMAMSRGGILCFAVALLVYLLLTKKGGRLSLFLLMLLSAGTTVVLATVASRFVTSGPLLPEVLTLACGPVIFLLYQLLELPVLRLLEGRDKAVKIGIGTLVVLGVLGVAAAMTLTNPFVLSEERFLYRQVDLTPGESYTASGDWDGDPQMIVYVEGEDDLLMDRYEVLYSGPISQVSFTIPSDTVVTHVQLRGDGEEIREVTFSDGTKMKMDYTLLPYTLETRLEDSMLTSLSFLLRVEYVKDALKIWVGSPIIGRGLGSTDNLYTAVQSFYYQSKFVHNHVVQYLADIGLIGLGFFLMIVGGLIWLLLRKRKEDGDPMAVMFLACMVMMNLHSLMEINFSVRAYGIMAYFLLAVMTLAYGKPLGLKGKETMKKAAALTAGCYWVLIAVFAGVCISYRTVLHLSESYQTESYEHFMETVENFITFDALDDDYYKILYLARGTDVPGYAANADKYAAQLRASGAFTNCDAVARYYYLPKGMLQEVFACSMEGIAQKAADKDSWNAEMDFYRATVLPTFEGDWANAREYFLQGVLSVRDYLTSYSVGRLEEIELTEENQAFLNAVEQVWNTPEMSHEESYAFLSQFSYAESEA